MRKTLSLGVLGLGALAGNAAAADTLSDSQVLGIYIQVNSFDIETALLARSQGESEAVRNLAAHVASDHTSVRRAAYELAKKCGASPSLPAGRDAAAAEHAAGMATLSNLQGTRFDTEYVRREVAFHRAAIGAVKTTLLPAARCAELKSHLQTVLPAFERHLAQTEALAAKN
jgi:putative membrane protein